MEEILHQLIGDLPHYLIFTGFLHPSWRRISAINSMTQKTHHFMTSSSKQLGITGRTGAV